ncbi:MAG: PD-(D/E)XK nuclease family protein [Steroidobacteraceae bacterium]
MTDPERVTSSADQARLLANSLDREQLVKGAPGWRRPRVTHFAAWLRERAARALLAANRPLRLLRPSEEAALWRDAASHAADQFGILDTGGLALRLTRSARLLDQMCMGAAQLRSHALPEARLLAMAAKLVAERAADLQAVPTHCLGRYLDDQRPVTSIEWLGFAQSTPLLRSIAGVDPVIDLPWGPLAGQSAQRVAADSVEDEIAAAGRWARSCIEDNPAARVHVVLPWDTAAGSSAAAIFMRSFDPACYAANGARNTNRVAFLGGASLRDQPVVAKAMDWLSLAIAELAFEQVAGLLRPYDADGRLEAALRRDAPPRLDYRALHVLLARCADPAAGDPLREQMLRLRQVAAAPHRTPGDWSVVFSEVVALCVPPLAGASGATGMISQLWRDALAEFGRLGSIYGRLTPAAALSQLGHVIAQKTLVPHQEAANVTVSDRYELPVERYDGVWIADCTADRWPGPPLLDAFVPFELQRDCNLRAASTGGQLALARQFLHAWSRQSRELMLSCSVVVDESQQLRWSSLLEGAAAAVHHRSIAPDATRSNAIRMAMQTDDTAPASPVSEPLPGGTRALKLQQDCPFRANAELRLGAARQDPPRYAIGPLLRGQIVHEALARFWRKTGSQADLRELANDPGALDSAIKGALHPAIADVAARRDDAQWQRLLEWEERRCQALIRKLLDSELQRCEFRVLAVEEEREIELAGYRLRLRLDRVDALSTRGQVVIDYKTGKSRLDASRDAQMAAYAHAVPDPVAGLLFARIDGAAVQFTGVSERADLAPRVKASGEFLADLERLRELATKLADDFGAGHAAVEPAKGVCANCHLPSLCRKMAIAAADEDSDD